MKNINKVILYGLVAMVPLAGCDTEDLHDLNRNPQAVTQISPNFIFTAAQLGTASGGSAGDNRIIDGRANIGYTGFWIQQMGGVGTGGNSSGNVYNEFFEANEAPWNFFYGDALKNISEVMRTTGPGGAFEGQHNNARQAARILRVLNFHRLTDFYGAIPYSDALQGLAAGVFYPTYDKQSEIYPDLLRELEEAAASFTPATPQGFNQADLVYNGDVDQWRRFAYSLMLRLAMRVSNVAPQLANEYVTKAVAGGVMQSNADNYVVPMAEGPSLWINQNGISRALWPGDGSGEAFLSETLVNWLKGNPTTTADMDPRLMIYAGGIGNWNPQGWFPANTNPLDQRGIPAGSDQQRLDQAAGRPVLVADEFSRINPLLLAREDPYVLMNYAEVAFLQAEALERGIGTGIQGSVQQWYENGVRAAMQMWTVFDPSLAVSDAQVNAYLAARPFQPGNALPMIYQQLWASKFLNFWEAWSDWRRTGYPQLTPVVHPAGMTNGIIPRRFRYPNQEAAVNDNFQAGATQPDLLTTRVWWDGGTEN
jgi:hypothetical protein